MESLACFFFFQAEDGIRDGRVTGVQTCALPIFMLLMNAHHEAIPFRIAEMLSGKPWTAVLDTALDDPCRSEERRVGKECRSRWSTDLLKKKEKEDESRIEA